MENQDPVVELQRETLAIQTLLVGLLNALNSRGPEFAAVVGEAFDYAEDILHGTVPGFDSQTANSHFRGTLQMIHQFRMGVQGHNDPKHSV